MWRLRRLIKSIQTTITWLPVIWNDRQWDSCYIEIILLKKITLMRKYTKERQFYVGWENEVKWMTRCIELLTMLIENKYWGYDYNNRKPSNRGFSENLTRNNRQFIENEYNEESPWQLSFPSDLWEDKARTLFWKIFVWRYERWWD